jgi:hypothetical protein
MKAPVIYIKAVEVRIIGAGNASAVPRTPSKPYRANNPVEPTS